MACACAGTDLTPAEKDWVIGYGAACGAHQATVDSLEAYDGNEDVVAILDRNMPVSKTWGRVAVFDAIRASSADTGGVRRRGAGRPSGSVEARSHRRRRCRPRGPRPTRAGAQAGQDRTRLRQRHSVYGQRLTTPPPGDLAVRTQTFRAAGQPRLGRTPVERVRRVPIDRGSALSAAPDIPYTGLIDLGGSRWLGTPSGG